MNAMAAERLTAAAAAAAQRTAERRKSRPRVAARPYSGKQDKRDKERQVARRVPVEEGGAEQVQCCSSRETRRGQAQTIIYIYQISDVR